MKCLICGKNNLIDLVPHIINAHHIRSDEYCRLFKLSNLIRTESIRKKISLSTIRKKKPKGSNYHKNSGSWSKGNIPWNKGKPWSEATKRKISLTYKEGRVRKKSPDSRSGHPRLKGETQYNNESVKKSAITLRKKYLEGKLKIPHITTYKRGFRKDLGHYVRSSWEANYCRILKYLDISYKYESKKFPLYDNNADLIAVYTPDIQIINIPDYFIELKGHYKSSIEPCYCNRCGVFNIRYNLFIQQYPNIKLIIIGQKEYKKILTHFSFLENLE